MIKIKREYRLRNKPTTQQYVNAFQAISHNEREIELLRKQYSMPARTATATQLAKLARMNGGHPAVNVAYGRLGHRLCDWLELDPDDGSRSEKNRWWSVLSVGYSTPNGFLWQMHPEVAASLEQLGWVQPQEQVLPEEINDPFPIFEGAIRNVRVNVFERNPQTRQQCIQHYGWSCCICGFNFAAHYGDSAGDYVQVHHLRALSEIGEQYEVDPVNDLRPVCPNCHAVLHLRVPSYTIEEVKEMIRTRCGPV